MPRSEAASRCVTITPWPGSGMLQRPLEGVHHRLDPRPRPQATAFDRSRAVPLAIARADRLDHRRRLRGRRVARLPACARPSSREGARRAGLGRVDSAAARAATAEGGRQGRTGQSRRRAGQRARLQGGLRPLPGEHEPDRARARRARAPRVLSDLPPAAGQGAVARVRDQRAVEPPARRAQGRAAGTLRTLQVVPRTAARCRGHRRHRRARHQRQPRLGGIGRALGHDPRRSRDRRLHGRAGAAVRASRMRSSRSAGCRC